MRQKGAPAGYVLKTGEGSIETAKYMGGIKMDAQKRQRYEKIAAEIVRLAGGRDNILGVAHCATRLRLVLEDNDRADIKSIEEVDLVKGVFVAGDQLQIIFGAGLVNDVCQVLADSIHMDSMSLGDLKTKANKRMNPLQRAVKALSDVFIEIMPGILAAALLTGLSRVMIPFTEFPL